MKDKKLMQLNSEAPILFTEEGNYFCFIYMYGYFVCMCVYHMHAGLTEVR